MATLATSGQICNARSTCTNCPIRTRCEMRKTFYSNEEYDDVLSISFEIAHRIGLAAGFPLSVMEEGDQKTKSMMDAKRDKELREHPVYSPI